ncbi:MAG: transcriptional repressor LexA, partial [Oscillospiraceae bacterium]
MNELTAKQREIYDYIILFTDEHGYPPSVREIGLAVNLKSPSTVHFHLKGLE